MNKYIAILLLTISWSAFADIIPDYNRADWNHWIDHDGDCLDTQREILLRESLTSVTFKQNDNCKVTGGLWYGPFLGRFFIDSSDLNLDHVIPLKWVHTRGGWRWTAEQKQTFANDYENLVLVDDGRNQSKDGKGPGYSAEVFQTNRDETETRAAWIAELLAQRKGVKDTTLEADKFYAETLEALTENRIDNGMAVTSHVIGDGTGTGGSPTTISQNIDFPAGTGTLKGMMFILVNDKANISPINGDNHGMGIGFTDGTNQYCMWSMTDHETTPAQLAARTMSDANLGIRNQGGKWDKTVKFNNFTTPDRAVIDVISYNAPTYFTIPVAFAGDNIDVQVGSHRMAAGIEKQKITTGHNTDLFIATSAYVTSYVTASPANQKKDDYSSFGLALKGTGVSQMCVSRYMDRNGGPNSQITSAIYDDSILAQLATPSVEVGSTSVTEMVADGVFIQNSADLDSNLMIWMSISWKNRPKMKMVNVTIPKAGDLVIESPGFKPRMGILFTLTGAAAYNTPLDVSMQMGITVFDEGSIHTGSLMCSDHDPLDNGTGRGKYYNKFALQDFDNSEIAGVDSSAYAFTNLGVTFTMTDWPASASLGRLLVIE